MNRVQKIALLKLWNVAIPAKVTNEQLDKLIADNRKSNRVLNYANGKLNVIFDRADESPVEVMIYDNIGDDPWTGAGFTAKDFVEALKDIDPTRPLDIRINSAGGLVWEGLAIKTRIDEWKGKKTASIDGMAASVASWLPMSVDEIRAPKHAQMFIHDAWGMCMGNAEDMRTQAGELDKTSDQIAGMYSSRTGMSADECRQMMMAGTLMTGEEALQMGFIDRVTDDEPIANFTAKQIANMKSKLAMLNSIKQPQPGDNKNTTMNRKEKIAKLNKWGVTVPENATDKWIDSMLRAGNPKNDIKFKNGKDGDHADDCDCGDCMSKNAPEPKKLPNDDPDDKPPGKDGDEGELWKEATENMKRETARMKRMNDANRRNQLQSSLNKLVEQGRITGNSVEDWLDEAMNKADADDGTNPIINRLAKLEPKLPGVAPLNIEVGDPKSLEEIDKVVNKLMEAQKSHARNGHGPESYSERLEVSRNSKDIQRLIKSLKTFDRKDDSIIAPMAESSGGAQMTGPLRAAWDRYSSGPRNANTMSASLLRQVILSEVMRAFRRQFVNLDIFSHIWQSVPLEGTDYVEVPYYPLATTASSEFTYAAGYTIGANAVTSNKQIFVGGIGNGVATGGSGRKYQSLQFEAYEIRRQPWLDIQKLSVLAGEQLAIDVRGDILGTWINSTNFGNAIYTGAAGGFDHTIVGNVLQQAAIAAFWPMNNRNVVLAPGYYTNLSIDPAITPLLAIGTTDVLRKGIVGGLYGFENIMHDPKLPVANFIQGGSGTLTNGTDPYLAGFMCYPSALLIATAPIMPPPGVLKKLVAYEQITDDQTGLAFTYQFWGNESANVDNEIIECTYGSGLGELAALFRLTSQGN